MEEINLETKDRLDKVRLSFLQGWYKLAHIVRFIKTAFGKDENGDNANATYM